MERVKELYPSYPEQLGLVSEGSPFGNDRLDAAVTAVLAKIPEGHTWAFLGIADEQSARASVVVKVNDNWQFGGYVEKPWHGSLTYGAELIVSGGRA